MSPSLCKTTSKEKAEAHLASPRNTFSSPYGTPSPTSKNRKPLSIQTPLSTDRKPPSTVSSSFRTPAKNRKAVSTPVSSNGKKRLRQALDEANTTIAILQNDKQTRDKKMSRVREGWEKETKKRKCAEKETAKIKEDLENTKKDLADCKQVLGMGI